MEKIKIIYNPKAGRHLLQKNIPRLVELLRDEGRRVHLFATQGALDAQEEAYESCLEGYDTIIVVGGDGTVNEVVNGVMKSDYRPQIAIYPAGTVNDFGNYLKVPRSIEEFGEMIIKNNVLSVDVGQVGERYFLNVAAVGLLTDVAYKVSNGAKTVLGKFAYYIEGIREFPKQVFKPIKVKIQMGERMEEKEILFLLIANSPSAGGFKYIAPEAKIDDGKFDLLIVEKSQLKDVAQIFIKTLKGSHITHPNLKYVQVESFRMDCEESPPIDLDGEMGGRLPMDFRVHKKGIQMIIP